MGTLGNDSSTVRKDQNIEFLLAEYKGKVTGYTRTTFMVDDNLYYIVKRVKGIIEGDICEIKDDDIISHNFPQRPEKKVNVISTFYRNKADSNWYLSGDWKTNQTKKYYAISGKMDLREEKDLAQSKLFPHLQELKLEKSLPFYQEAEKSNAPILAKTHIKPQKQKGIDVPDAALNTGIVKTNTTKLDPVVSLDQRAETNIAPEAQIGVARQTTKPNAGTVKTNTTTVAPVVTLEQKTETNINTQAQQGIARQTVKPNAGTVKTNTTSVAPVVTMEQKTETNISPEKQNIAKQDLPKTNSPTVKTNTIQVAPPPISSPAIFPPTASAQPVDPNAPAAYAAQRQTEATQFINFTADSLVFALYDNGEVDGDTVSVLVNGEIFLAKQGLKTSAIKKTFYLPPGNDEMTLILYAENLGKYPPNTGLLVVYDGEERHQVRFSADLNKNAAVVFKRKK
jgi:hypothetical protein